MSGRYRWSDVWSEVVEVVAAILTLQWTAVKEEMSDLLFTLQMKVYLDLQWLSAPIFGGGACFQKNVERMAVWKDLFEGEGLVFDPKFLVNGSNWAKPEKVQLAFRLAREEAGKAETVEEKSTETVTLLLRPSAFDPFDETDWENDIWDLVQFQTFVTSIDLDYLKEVKDLEVDQWVCA